MRISRAFNLVKVFVPITVASMALLGCGSDGGSGSDSTTTTTTEAGAEAPEPSDEPGESAEELTEVDSCELLTNEQIAEVLAATINEGPTENEKKTACQWGLGTSPASYVKPGEQTAEVPVENDAPGNGQISVSVRTGFTPDDIQTTDGYTTAESTEVEGLYLSTPDQAVIDGVQQPSVSALIRRGVSVMLNINGGVVPGTGNGGPQCTTPVVDGCDPGGFVQLPAGPGTDQLFALYAEIGTALDNM